MYSFLIRLKDAEAVPEMTCLRFFSVGGIFSVVVAVAVVDDVEMNVSLGAGGSCEPADGPTTIISSSSSFEEEEDVTFWIVVVVVVVVGLE